jgi:hypothetical protein
MFEHGVSGFVPHYIAAVVPDGLTEFTRALIFFHPLPTERAGYFEADYVGQTGRWPYLHRYCHQQGGQLAASGRKMVLIFPIFNLAATETCGRFPEDWKLLLEDIMVKLRQAHAPEQVEKAKPTITDVVTASFSAGVKYMHTFLNRATNLKPYLREVYDYDGRFSSHKDLSEKLNIQNAKLTTYDQHAIAVGQAQDETTAKNGIHVPEWRWFDKEIEVEDQKTKKMIKFRDSTFIYNLATEKNVKQRSDLVHSAIAGYMMFHSLSRSSVG